MDLSKTARGSTTRCSRPVRNSASNALAGGPTWLITWRWAFPQIRWSFIPFPAVPDERASAFISKFLKFAGSVDPADLRARFRTPVEVGWHRMCKFDHDFLGRAALESEVANPKRTVVTLRW